MQGAECCTTGTRRARHWQVSGSYDRSRGSLRGVEIRCELICWRDWASSPVAFLIDWILMIGSLRCSSVPYMLCFNWKIEKLDQIQVQAFGQDYFVGAFVFSAFLFFLPFFFKFSPEDMFIDFREGRYAEWETERKRERNIDLLPPVCTLTRDRTCNLGMCPDWESNTQHFGAQNDAPVNWATQPGLCFFFLFLFFFSFLFLSVCMCVHVRERLWILFLKNGICFFLHVTMTSEARKLDGSLDTDFSV